MNPWSQADQKVRFVWHHQREVDEERENCSALVGNLMSSQENSWKDIREGPCTTEMCAGMHPSGVSCLDRDIDTFIMQQGLMVTVLNFLYFMSNAA